MVLSDLEFTTDEEVEEIIRQKYDALMERARIDVETREIRWPYIFHPGRHDCFEYIDTKMHREELANCAEDALNYYNKKRGTKYKYLRPLKMSCCTEDLYRIHCNFTAKSEKHPRRKGGSSVKLFFAELEYHGGPHFVVNCCRVIKAGKSKIGCPMCPGMIDHPPSLPLEKRSKYIWYVESDDSSKEDNGPDHKKVKSTESVPGKIDGTNDENLSHEKFDSCNKTKDRQSDSFKLNWVAAPWDHIYQCAGKALALYNRKSGTDYQYMEPVDISYSSNWWIFCRFTARFESPSLKDGDSPIKLFFAELGGNADGEVVVTSCDVLSSLTHPGNWFTPQTTSAPQYHQAPGNWFTPQTTSAPQYHQAPGNWFTPQTTSTPQYHQGRNVRVRARSV